tara:strand:+ start:1162 stop:1338 length:177 start_codon:yes stop_codon:yes gene_type:complete
MDINEDFETLVADIAIDVVNEFVEQGLLKDRYNYQFQTDAIKDAIKDALHRYQANFKY